MKSTFSTELEMSKCFEQFVQKTFGNTYLKETDGLSGIPDYILYHKEEDHISIVTFELKLQNWHRAAQQAFRYKSFSHLCFVVMANECESAKKNLDFFIHYNIGLAQFDKHLNLDILHVPKYQQPYSEGLTCKLVSKVEKKTCVYKQ